MVIFGFYILGDDSPIAVVNLNILDVFLIVFNFWSPSFGNGVFVFLFCGIWMRYFTAFCSVSTNYTKGTLVCCGRNLTWLLNYLDFLQEYTHDSIDSATLLTTNWSNVYQMFLN